MPKKSGSPSVCAHDCESVTRCACPDQRFLRVLLNNLILDKVTSHLPPKDLLHLRRTTVIWNRTFIPVLRRSHSPIIPGFSDCGCDEHFDNVTCQSKVMMEDYIGLMRQSPEVPFGRYELPDISTDIHHQPFDEFFSLCGETISHVQLLCRGSTQLVFHISNLAKIRRFIFERMPNLEGLRLTIEIYDPSTPPTSPGPPVPAADAPEPRRIVRPLPCLKHLTLDGNTSDFSSDEFYCILRDVVQQAPSLEKLHLEFQLLAKLSHPHQDFLRLKAFSTSLESHRDNCKALHSFLSPQSSTLQHLSIRLLDLRLHTLNPIELPRMEELRTLKLTRLGPPNIRCHGDSLGTSCPHLECLEISRNLNNGPCETGLTNLSQLAHPGVKEFILSCEQTGRAWIADVDESLAELGQLRELLPAVTKFEASIPGDNLPRSIWTIWPTLTVLRVKYDNINADPMLQCAYDQATILEASGKLDEWLSGITRSRFPALEAEPCYQLAKGTQNEDDDGETLRDLRSLLETYKSLPGISDLLCLRQFTLILKPRDPRMTFNVTDIGGCFGLAMASHTLEHLVLKSMRCFRQNQVSPKCKSLIRTALGPHALIELGGE